MYRIKIKVKVTSEQVTEALRGSRCIRYSFFNLGFRWEWLVKATPRPL
jgi:hypothetical protein